MYHVPRPALYQEHLHLDLPDRGQPGKRGNKEEILKTYPSLTREDIRAALAFTAEMARERVEVPLAEKS